MEQINKLYEAFTDEWFNICFNGVNQLDSIKQKAKNIIIKFKIGGFCDPGYIANVLGSHDKQAAIKKILFCYKTSIAKSNHTISEAKKYLNEVA